MRYAEITKCELSNGNDVGVSLYVQGCPLHCEGCFNPSTWDFSGGEEWNTKVEKYLFDLIAPFYIKRISILGGEPLSPINRKDVMALIKRIKEKFPEKKIWVYTGYDLEDVYNLEILQYIDVLVDGAFHIKEKDLSLAFRGSSNQRLIDMKETLKTGEIVIWNTKIN